MGCFFKAILLCVFLALGSQAHATNKICKTALNREPQSFHDFVESASQSMSWNITQRRYLAQRLKMFDASSYEGYPLLFLLEEFIRLQRQSLVTAEARLQQAVKETASYFNQSREVRETVSSGPVDFLQEIIRIFNREEALWNHRLRGNHHDDVIEILLQALPQTPEKRREFFQALFTGKDPVMDGIDYEEKDHYSFVEIVAVNLGFKAAQNTKVPALVAVLRAIQREQDERVSEPRRRERKIPTEDRNTFVNFLIHHVPLTPGQQEALLEWILPPTDPLRGELLKYPALRSPLHALNADFFKTLVEFAERHLGRDTLSGRAILAARIQAIL